MKTYIFVFSLLLASVNSFAQEVFNFSDASNHNLRISELDSTYQSAIHSDSTKAVFHDQQQFAEAYKQLLQDFGSFLHENKFNWEQRTSGFNRVYFNADGKVDYFVYTFRSPMSQEKTTRFEQLLREFLKTYTFPMTASVKFGQCSPVTYVPQTD